MLAVKGQFAVLVARSRLKGTSVSKKKDRRGGRWKEWEYRREGEATSLEVVGRTRRMEDGLGSVAQEGAPMERLGGRGRVAGGHCA